MNNEKKCCPTCDDGNDWSRFCSHPMCSCHTQKPCCVKCFDDHGNGIVKKGVLGRCKNPDCPCHSENPAQEESIILSRAYVPRIERPIQEKPDVLIQIRKHKCEVWNDDNDMQEGTAWGVIIDAAPPKEPVQEKDFLGMGVRPSQEEKTLSYCDRCLLITDDHQPWHAKNCGCSCHAPKEPMATESANYFDAMTPEERKIQEELERTAIHTSTAAPDDAGGWSIEFGRLLDKVGFKDPRIALEIASFIARLLEQAEKNGIDKGMDYFIKDGPRAYSDGVRAERSRIEEAVGKLRDFWTDADGGGGRSGYNAALDAVLKVIRGEN